MIWRRSGRFVYCGHRQVAIAGSVEDADRIVELCNASEPEPCAQPVEPTFTREQFYANPSAVIGAAREHSRVFLLDANGRPMLTISTQFEELP